jgi:uncharacterized lipoprotein YddW (UPF0748 family)
VNRFIIYGVFVICSVQLAAQQKTEFRATWLTNVDSYVLTSDNSIVEAVNYLSSMGVNVIFPVVYNKGYTLYPSTIMDSLFSTPVIPGSGFQNRDFLERIIIEAHRVGIEVIPWFEFGFSSSYSLNGGHIVAKFPHWASKNNQGSLLVKNGFDWLSGINPEVQDYMLGLVMEVIDNYDVDGVQGDDRLPAMPVEGGYDSVTVEIYKSEHSGQTPPFNYYDAGWKRWRADKLNSFFVRMRDSVKSRSPNLILSSSPTPYPWGYDEYLQDSKYWAQNNIVDNIIPQLYRYDYQGYQSVLSQSLSQIRSVNPDIYFAGVLIKSGSYIITPSLLLQKIQLNRTSSVMGECTFFYEGLRANNNRNGDTLKNSIYSGAALVPYRNGNIWRPPARIRNEEDAGVIVSNAWESYPQSGYSGGIIRTGAAASYESVIYNMDIEYSAYYDVYTYSVPNTVWTKNARYVLYSGNDSTEYLIDQSNLNKKGWQKTGTVYLSEGNQQVLKIDNTYLESGKYLVADAVMLMINRKLSPDVIISDAAEEKTEQPLREFYLNQNYPNPFNPITRISFRLNEVSEVLLTVYDVLGNEITRLVDEGRPAGEHFVDFNASLHNLSSGVYFCRLVTGRRIEIIKMLLMK